jgi:hypothetical protein
VSARFYSQCALFDLPCLTKITPFGIFLGWFRYPLPDEL